MAEAQMVLFAPRFLETHAGASVLNDPITALIELLANAWDAAATRVEIQWPAQRSHQIFSITDNGHGMTRDQFYRRWLTLAYDRRQEQGDDVEVRVGPNQRQSRVAFGRNGIGRHGALAFGDSYVLSTWRDGTRHTFRITQGSKAPLEVEELSVTPIPGTGTIISAETGTAKHTFISAETARQEIGLRFLIDPSFAVFVDGVQVGINDIPPEQVQRVEITVPGVGPITITVLDTRETDRSTAHHGIAWHVRGRLVGTCSWQGSGHEKFLDGRRAEAKRFTFFISADGLDAAVLPDWSGFDYRNLEFRRANEQVQSVVQDILVELTREKRSATTRAVASAHRGRLSEMTSGRVEKWTKFVDQAQVACPSISERELTQLAGVLAQLELSNSKFGLIGRLHQYAAGDLDRLDTLLSEWTLDTAKIVLDELQTRIKLVDELRRKVKDPASHEVHDLQPLFHQGLWIFGPEYETIEFTSNEGITTVIRKLMKQPVRGSTNRPDFVIVPDGSAGFYSYPKYDSAGGEIGVDRLTVVELKRPGIPISTDQKTQAWKYVKELYDLGQLQEHSAVTCFVLGSEIDVSETEERTEKGGRVVIRPLSYDTVLVRAKSRLLKLFDRVKSAPFLDQKEIEEFLHPTVTKVDQGELLDDDALGNAQNAPTADKLAS